MVKMVVDVSLGMTRALELLKGIVESAFLWTEASEREGLGEFSLPGLF